MVEKTRSVPTVKLKLAAIRSLFRYLHADAVIEMDPAASVRAPKHSVALRDRALIGLMTYTLARVSAAVDMKVADVRMIRSRGDDCSADAVYCCNMLWRLVAARRASAQPAL